MKIVLHHSFTDAETQRTSLALGMTFAQRILARVRATAAIHGLELVLSSGEGGDDFQRLYLGCAPNPGSPRWKAGAWASCQAGLGEPVFGRAPSRELRALAHAAFGFLELEKLASTNDTRAAKRGSALAETAPSGKPALNYGEVFVRVWFTEPKWGGAEATIEGPKGTPFPVWEVATEQLMTATAGMAKCGFDEAIKLLVDGASMNKGIFRHSPEAVETCTGVAASWCPIHGQCSCPKSDDGERLFESQECPLHGEHSDHADTRG